MKITKDTEDKNEDMGLGENFRRLHEGRKAIGTVQSAADRLASSEPLEQSEREQIASELFLALTFFKNEYSLLSSQPLSGSKI